MPALYHVKEIVFLVGMVLAVIVMAPILWPISVFRGWLHPQAKTDETSQLNQGNTELVTVHPPEAADVARAVEGLHKHPVLRK